MPAAYGGFETAAENIALYLARKGWRVIVYCQTTGRGPVTEDTWRGIERVHIPIDIPGWKGTSKFDWLSIRHACQHKDICLTFGYNTAIFNTLQRVRSIPNVINMDGIEWSRARWGFVKQAILYVNERIACYVGNHLIADHPEIEKYLSRRAPRRKLTTITYGADPVEDAPQALLTPFNLLPRGYATLVARSIPENSILEIVKGFSNRPRGIKLVVLGKYEPATNLYHKAVMGAASKEVMFAGAIYQKEIVQALRFHGVLYLHGHTVGGTNPSLVEALAAGNPIVAHDNAYNRWVAGDSAVYFDTAESVDRHLCALLSDPQKLRRMNEVAIRRFNEEFTWDHVAGQYEELLLRYVSQ